MNRIRNQPLRYHGGKSGLAAWIHSLAPPSVIADPLGGYTHRNIAYAGGLGEFWNWEPVEGISEAVNDLNGEIANLYSMLRSETTYNMLVRLCDLSPFGDDTFDRSKFDREFSPAVWRAWGFLCRYRMSRQGLGKCYATPTTRIRRGMNENVSAWLSAVDGLPECHERLRRVEIRNMKALEFLAAYDHPRALFYLDPPYMHETRQTTGEYGEYEMRAADHDKLLSKLAGIQGRFMLSGYHSAKYDSYARVNNWHVSEKASSLASSSKTTKQRKVEVVWTNYVPPCVAVGNTSGERVAI